MSAALRSHLSYTLGVSSIAANKMPRSSRAKPGSQPSLVRKGPVSRRALLAHIEPGPAEETEEFVRFIYELRRKAKSRIALG